MSKPIPGDLFRGLQYTNTAPADGEISVSIKDWVESIGKADPSPDLLSKFDQSIDGSIGGLGTSLEKMFNSQRAVPLIEFRDLADVQTKDIEQFMKNVDAAVQKLHGDFANAPTKRKRDVPDYCTQLDNANTATTSSASFVTTTSALSSPLTIAPADPPS